MFGTRLLNEKVGSELFFYKYWTDQAILLQWSFNNTLIASRIPGYLPRCIPQYTERCQMDDDGSLRLYNLTFSDEGTYILIEKPPGFKEDIYELKVYGKYNFLFITIYIITIIL